LANHHVHALVVFTDEDQVHVLATAQHLETLIRPNPDRADEKDPSPEEAVMRFGDTEVVVLGVGLRGLADMISSNTLQLIQPLPDRYRPARNLQLLISSITVRRATPP